MCAHQRLREAVGGGALLRVADGGSQERAGRQAALGALSLVSRGAPSAGCPLGRRLVPGRRLLGPAAPAAHIAAHLSCDIVRVLAAAQRRVRLRLAVVARLGCSNSGRAASATTIKSNHAPSQQHKDACAEPLAFDSQCLPKSNPISTAWGQLLCMRGSCFA